MLSVLARLSGLAAPLTRGMTLGVRAACIDSRGHVFMVRHTYMPGWYFPGGGVERSESVSDALKRELREEGGITLEGAPTLFGFYWNRRRPRDHIAFYVCRAFSLADVPVYPNREIADAGFFDPHALPDGTTPSTLRRLAEILEGHPPSDHW
ncbi:NUDIX domain-containing protein [Kaistia dalseonensis]|uniref:8-oxo-dGTP pyrophosphatase MutT (NUDIX family) n=1 Tax=Kaistia dalseonensis TaxID=410840 RepID=A0ABU0H6Z3_9HYPH|nr:NUDIX domain-containing protein [Kaistia dalseonensis]MCX5495217.1 NUDIX domain-containing protein [Kaistia dalseonensis]MDQ0437802.1 8-oxo-dGTP pyrophosphatase MutT (NUDIX family) [Kaistia dalseonensis]